MATPVQMPKQGNSVEECLIVEWNAAVGAAVQENDLLCTIETDKASFEVTAPASGTLLKTFFDAGELVPVLVNIAVIGDAGEDADAFAPDGAATSEPTPAAPEASASASSAAVRTPVPAPAGNKVRISPLARKLAAEMNVDIAQIPGSGPTGRILSTDVRQAAASGVAAPQATAPAPLAAPAIDEPPTEVPYAGIRKLIGDRMMQSLNDHAQLTLNASADASALLAYRKKIKAHAESLGLPASITLNDMLGFVVARTLLHFPELNAAFDKPGAKLMQYSQVHLAFAVDTPRGLMVPVIRNAHALSLATLSAESLRLAEQCRSGSIDPDLLQGGTFTVTNLGSLGVEHFTPVLNSPQVAILGIGAIDQKPVPAPDGSVAWQPTMALSLTIDHQVVDGAPAARFLKAIVNGLANLELVLAQ